MNSRDTNGFGTPDFFRPFFGPGGIVDELFGDADGSSYIPFGRKKFSTDEEGNEIVEYNLAGFSKEQIEVDFDKALKRVKISASDGDTRNFKASFDVDLYVKEKDISLTYNNGILRFVIKQSTDEDKKNNVKRLVIE